MKKKYIVTLREVERETLQAMLSRGKAAARKLDAREDSLEGGRQPGRSRLER